MSFGNNVIYYRKKYNVTQEELAEKMDVTRQTVSRWETDNAFPEMEKLIQLCDMFHCDMDTLVRGDAAKNDLHEDSTNLKTYDKHMNGFTAAITAGVCIILIGLSLLMFFEAFLGENVLGVVILLSFITVAVALFVASGISHSNFIGENVRVEKYPTKEVKAFRRKMPFLIAGATALILIGVIVLIAMTYREGYAPAGFVDAERYECFSVGIFFLFIATAVGIYVCTGMLCYKYDIKAPKAQSVQSLENSNDGNDTAKSGETESVSKARKGERITSACSGVIMLSCTCAYLLMGFLGDLWHPGWVVFPIGGILCGIISIIMEAVYGKR